MSSLTSGDLNRLKVMASEVESHLSGLALTEEGKELVYAPFGTEQGTPLALAGSRARRALPSGKQRTKVTSFDHLVTQSVSLTRKLDNLNGAAADLTRKAKGELSPDEPDAIFPGEPSEQAIPSDIKAVRGRVEQVVSAVIRTLDQALGAIQKDGEDYPSFKFERVRSADGRFGLKTVKIASVKPPESAAKKISRDWLAIVDGLKMELAQTSEKITSLRRNMEILVSAMEDRGVEEEEMVR